MATFMVILCKIHKREEFINGYGRAVPDVVNKYGGEYLIVAPGATLLEGGLEGYSSVAISKWPSRSAALEFWESEDYADVKKLREGLADAEVLIVDAPD